MVTVNRSQQVLLRVFLPILQTFRWVGVMCCLPLLLFSLGACGVVGTAAEEPNAAIAQTYANLPRLNGEATIEMVVNSGGKQNTVTLAIHGEAAPLTAGNFVDLVQKGFYNGLTFHRVVNEPVPFVVQGGDPNGDGTGGYVDPQTRQPRQIPLEISLEGEKQPHYNTLLDPTQHQLALPHLRKALAMARSSTPNSASSQFYIALSDQPQLDGRYAVFGEVTGGMDVVDKIQVSDKIVSMKVVKGADLLQLGG
jgi:peptidyl-prolyl cis-trans isomerase B (cyclophilin B)